VIHETWLPGPVSVVGSRGDCDLPLQIPNVSNVHCVLIRTPRAAIVLDLCSRQGTLVNGVRVHARVLQRTDRIQVGPVELRLSWVEGDEPPLPPGEMALQIDPPLILVGADGPFVVRRLPAVIGRRRTADVSLDTPNVSLAHAILLELEDRLFVLDLGSRSGTLLNGQRVEAAFVASGDMLEIGGERLRVVLQATNDAAAAVRQKAPEGHQVIDRAVETLHAWPSRRERLRNSVRRLRRIRRMLREWERRLAEREAALRVRERQLSADRERLERQRRALGNTPQERMDGAAADRPVGTVGREGAVVLSTSRAAERQSTGVSDAAERAPALGGAWNGSAVPGSVRDTVVRTPAGLGPPAVHSDGSRG